MMKCHFNEFTYITQATPGTWGKQVYRLNSVWDPNATTILTDKSATPHTTMSAVYNKY